MNLYPKGAGAAAAVITAGTMAATLGLQALSAPSAAAAQPDAARPIAAAATRSTSGTICIPTYHRGG